MSITINETRSYSGSVPAGRWFAGDPRYAIRDEQWDSLLAQTDYLQEKPDGVTPDGRQAVAFRTAHGDGSYRGVTRSDDDADFSVDSGTLGLVQARDGEACPDGMQEITSTHPVRFEAKDGVITLGRYTIDTN